jgi:cytochrome c
MISPVLGAMKNLTAKCWDWNKRTELYPLKIKTITHTIMKKVLLAFGIAAACYACGGGTTEGENKPISNNETNANSQIGGEAAPAAAAAAPATDTATAPAATAPAAAAGKDGKALIAGSDCLTCHKEDAKLIGPAYKEVAKKYESNDKNVKMLAEKILKGGQGVWGEIPMAGHPNLSAEDAEAMVKYILSLK